MAREDSYRKQILNAVYDGEINQLESLMVRFGLSVNESLGMFGNILCVAIQVDQLKIIDFLIQVRL